MGKIRIESFIRKATDAINLKLMSTQERANFESRDPQGKARYLGFDNGFKQNFDTPQYISSPSEQTIVKGNSYIVLGLDRPSNIFSGFGGKQNTHSAAIDIVVGRLGYRGSARTSRGTLVNADPNFKLDAARIYISQKSDPDGYFGLVAGNVGNTSVDSPRSTVALKADTLRLIARENIKLVTRTDGANSQGAPLGNTFVGNYGIDLIALNDDKGLQPMVKGENLKECLAAIIGSINDLHGLIENFIEEDRELHQAFLKHTHYSPFFGSMTSPDFTGMPANIKSLINKITNTHVQMNVLTQKLTTVQTNYLEAPAGATASKDGKSQYILSRYNNTN
jgi:hypothetical protein